MTRRIVLIDPGAGNLKSLERALRRGAEVADVGAVVDVSADPEALSSADAVVLPGQGHFGDVRRSLDAAGLTEAVQEFRAGGDPLLGVCVGYQLFFDGSEEDGWTEGFSWLPGRLAILPAGPTRKVPHMGWNRLSAGTSHPATDGLIGEHVYFAHSYAVKLKDDQAACVTAWTDYGGRLPAAAAADNALGVQFHPEKSQAAGLAFLADFMRWRP